MIEKEFDFAESVSGEKEAIWDIIYNFYIIKFLNNDNH